MPRMGRIPAAEAMPVEDETRQFIQQVRRTTRRKLTAEEKVRSCWRASGARPGCQTSPAGEGINPNVYYAWLPGTGCGRRRCRLCWRWHVPRPSSVPGS